jgi:uncharacterized protein YoxC
MSEFTAILQEKSEQTLDKRVNELFDQCEKIIYYITVLADDTEKKITKLFQSVDEIEKRVCQCEQKLSTIEKPNPLPVEMKQLPSITRIETPVVKKAPTHMDIRRDLMIEMKEQLEKRRKEMEA